MGDLMVYLPSIAEHGIHLREVCLRLQKKGFNLNKVKITCVASEIQYSGHYLSSRGVRMIPERTEGIKNFPCPTTSKPVWWALMLRSFRKSLGKLLLWKF
jgi:hypothetical protein